MVGHHKFGDELLSVGQLHRQNSTVKLVFIIIIARFYFPIGIWFSELRDAEYGGIPLLHEL